MRLLLTGSGGALGRQLVTFFQKEHELICLYRNREPKCIHCTSLKIDLNDEDGLIHAFRGMEGFDAIVHCAAMARPIECERDVEQARNINVPKVLIQALKASGVKDCLFVHISTDQVYEGTGTMYREEDPKHPVNAYGKTKLESEEYVRQNWSNHVILRSSLIYGKSMDGTGFFTDFVDRSLSRYVHDGQVTDFYSDEYRCPIYALDICNIVSIVLKKGLERKLVHRTYNMGGPERLSRSDMAYLIAKERGHPKESIRCVSSSTVDRGVPSPLDISMNIERLVLELGYKPTKFADALRILHEEEILETNNKERI